MSQILKVLSSVETVPDKDRSDPWALYLANVAVSVLIEEAELTPKPALVD